MDSPKERLIAMLAFAVWLGFNVRGMTTIADNGIGSATLSNAAVPPPKTSVTCDAWPAGYDSYPELHRPCVVRGATVRITGTPGQRYEFKVRVR